MRRGVTLVELIVVLAILGVFAGVTALAFRRKKPVPSALAWASEVAAARRTALDSARQVSLTVQIGDSVYAATAMPDGSVIADPQLGIDRLTGAPTHAP
jgi:prepilin-type N-terminal cleavage/methylation domain-containing protein